MVTNYKGKSQPENIVLNIGINSKYQDGTMVSSIRRRFPRANMCFIELKKPIMARPVIAYRKNPSLKDILVSTRLPTNLVTL